MYFSNANIIARKVGKIVGDIIISIIVDKGVKFVVKGLKGLIKSDKLATILNKIDNVDDTGKISDDIDVEIRSNACITGGISNSLDEVFQNGKRIFDNFNIEDAYVKPKHLSNVGGKARKFLGDSKIEAEKILKDSLKNGKIISITDNGLTKAGNASYEIIIDAGKVIGTRGETSVKIILSEDGGMLSAYPVN